MVSLSMQLLRNYFIFVVLDDGKIKTGKTSVCHTNPRADTLGLPSVPVYVLQVPERICAQVATLTVSILGVAPSPVYRFTLAFVVHKARQSTELLFGCAGLVTKRVSGVSTKTYLMR